MSLGRMSLSSIFCWECVFRNIVRWASSGLCGIWLIGSQAESRRACLYLWAASIEMPLLPQESPQASVQGKEPFLIYMRSFWGRGLARSRMVFCSFVFCFEVFVCLFVFYFLFCFVSVWNCRMGKYFKQTNIEGSFSIESGIIFSKRGIT